MTRRHLLVVSCAARPAADIGALITIAHQAGWSCAVTATPNALSFLDSDAIQTMTGSPPRTGYEARPDSDQTRTVGKADAVIIAPATFNFVNKLAAGIADNYALTAVAELVGLAVPAIIVPFVNAALAARVPYQNALRTLQAEGICLLGPQDQWEPHEPGTGAQRQRQFPWQQAFERAQAMSKGKAD